MMSGSDRPWRWLLLAALLVMAAACGRTRLPGPCPEGFNQDEAGICVCGSDAVCPDGLSCVDGACRCTGDACCPPGHMFAAAEGDAPDRCVCAGDACCPEGMTYDAEADACDCRGDGCCPIGHRWHETQTACVCAADNCCPLGYAWDEVEGTCECAGDECCPEGLRFDAVGEGCTCAEDECCPAGHVFSDLAKACVCTGVGCCPDGFERAPDGSCTCADDSACPFGLTCDRATGRCVCERDTDCQPDSFCNPFGFCQSLSGCGSNLDCPAGFFCFAAMGQCLEAGTCGDDVHCPIGAICDQARCRLGCNVSEDCPLLEVCIAGRCQANRCDDSSYCSLRSFCDPISQTCGPPDRDHCRSCDAGCNTGPCLSRIIEGDRTMSFCGVECGDASDCPGQMGCANSYRQCNQPGDGSCGEGLLCRRVEVLNDGPRNYCVDPATRRPSVVARYCSPRTGMCQ